MYFNVYKLMLGYFKIFTSIIGMYYFFSSTWTVSSTATLSQSSASLGIEGDLLEHFGLSESCPTEFHIAALYGI